MADLATMWCVNGWAKSKFPEFLRWAASQLGVSSFGDLNHGKRFVMEFLPSLVAAVDVGIASSLHSMVPALGIPSLFARVIDVVSVKGQSLFLVIYVYTNHRGRISWALLGCPCLENITKSDAANGATPVEQSSIFGCHKAPQLVRKVHELEKSFNIGREDRVCRLVTTVGDQAIQGPGSTQFTKHECAVDCVDQSPLSEAICKFHIVDGVGNATDKAFAETDLFDKMLRLVRRNFGWGIGKLILRAVAAKFECIAKDFDEKACSLHHKADDAEFANQLILAKHLRQHAFRAAAEAKALRRAGWATWRQPTAPKADGTRKVVWQTRSRDTFFKIYGFIFWGIQARMHQSLENVREARTKQGQVVTAKTGMRTKEMRAWRSLGRAMLDIHMLVFNLGRSDFRRLHLRYTRSRCSRPSQPPRLSQLWKWATQCC